MQRKKKLLKEKTSQKKKWYTMIAIVLVGCSIFLLPKGCSQEKQPTRHFDDIRDSIPIMLSKGVSAVISDSGYMRYKLITEEWNYYDKTLPKRQEFPRGLFLERLGAKDSIELFLTADSAWCYNDNLWHFKGHVFVNNLLKKTTFRTSELFWDKGEHKFYSNKYMKIIGPEHKLEGTNYWATEDFTRYGNHNGKGYLPKEATAAKDTVATKEN